MLLPPLTGCLIVKAFILKSFIDYILIMFPLPNPSQILPTHLHVLILSLKNEKAIKKLSKQKKKPYKTK